MLAHARGTSAASRSPGSARAANSGKQRKGTRACESLAQSSRARRYERVQRAAFGRRGEARRLERRGKGGVPRRAPRACARARAEKSTRGEVRVGAGGGEGDEGPRARRGDSGVCRDRHASSAERAVHKGAFGRRPRRPLWVCSISSALASRLQPLPPPAVAPVRLFFPLFLPRSMSSAHSPLSMLAKSTGRDQDVAQWTNAHFWRPLPYVAAKTRAPAPLVSPFLSQKRAHSTS